MKNTLFMRRVLESECQCSRRHLEEYNQHGVWCWWRQSWCRHVRESRFVSMFFQSLWKLVGKCAKFLCLCNIVKSRLVSRLRFFFLHLMMTTISSSVQNVWDANKTGASFSFLLSSSARFAYVCIRVRFSDENHLFLFLFCDPKFFALIEKQKKIHYTSDDGCFQASQMLRRLSFLRVSVF